MISSSAGGGAINKHEGNIKFRVFCDANKKHYIKSGKKKGSSKYTYCMSVLQKFKSMGCRFVQFDEATDSWYEVDDKKARMRIDRRFREPHSSKIVEYSPPPLFISNSIKCSRGITSIGPNHVLFGIGKRIDTNKGNVKFRDYCNLMGGEYASFHTTREKTQLTYQVLQKLYSMGLVFLSFNKQLNKWYEVEPGPIRAKIAKRLRLSVLQDKSTRRSKSKRTSIGKADQPLQKKSQKYIVGTLVEKIYRPSSSFGKVVDYCAVTGKYSIKYGDGATEKVGEEEMDEIALDASSKNKKIRARARRLRKKEMKAEACSSSKDRGRPNTSLEGKIKKRKRTNRTVEATVGDTLTKANANGDEQSMHTEEVLPTSAVVKREYDNSEETDNEDGEEEERYECVRVKSEDNAWNDDTDDECGECSDRDISPDEAPSSIF